MADTNNHSIRIIDVADGARVWGTGHARTLNFTNPERLQIAGRPTVIAGNAAAGLQLRLPDQNLAPGAGEIELDIGPGAWWASLMRKDNAHSRTCRRATNSTTWRPSAASGAAMARPCSLMKRICSNSCTNRSCRCACRCSLVDITTEQPGEDLLRGDLTIYYCEAIRDSLCFIERVTLEAPLNVVINDPDTTLEQQAAAHAGTIDLTGSGYCVGDPSPFVNIDDVGYEFNDDPCT